jgi:MATE family multidrug resistance protein
MLTYAGCMVIMLGISITTSIFVGRCIGMGNIEGGRIYEKVALVFSLIVALILLVLIYIFQSSIASAFTTVVEVQDLAKSALKIVAFLPIPLAIFYIETGVFRGMSKQQTSAFFSIVTLFIISIPLGCYLAYCAGMNIAGFWVGFITRTCFCAAIFLFLSFKWFDWNEVARETRDRERVIRQKLATSDESETQASYGTINEKA